MYKSRTIERFRRDYGPEEIEVGRGALTNFAQNYVQKSEQFPLGNKPIIFTGQRHSRQIAEEAAEYLRQSGADVCEVYSPGMATTDSVARAYTFTKRRRPTCIIVIGGGGPIDLGKTTAKSLSIPLVVSPTTASHDGALYKGATILDSKVPYKLSVDTYVPTAGYFDPLDVMQSGRELTVYGTLDLLGNLASTTDYKRYKVENERFSLQAYNLACDAYEKQLALLDSFETAFKPGNERETEELVEGQIHNLINSSIAMNIDGSSLPCSGSEHAVGHAAELFFPDVKHGLLTGLGLLVISQAKQLIDGERLNGSDFDEVAETVLGKLGASRYYLELDLNVGNIASSLIYAPNVRPNRYTYEKELQDKGKLTPENAKEVGRNVIDAIKRYRN